MPLIVMKSSLRSQISPDPMWRYAPEASRPWRFTRPRQARVNAGPKLTDEVLRDPFEGIGLPEPLRHAFAGSWSRRISEEHRLVYLVDSDDIVILQARYHYS
jgi:toxin YoeB